MVINISEIKCIVNNFVTHFLQRYNLISHQCLMGVKQLNLEVYVNIFTHTKESLHHAHI